MPREPDLEVEDKARRQARAWVAALGRSGTLAVGEAWP